MYNYNSPFADFLLQELWRAYDGARKGKRKTLDEHRFELNAIENILLLRNSILHRNYQPSRGVAFIVHDPVTREIVAAPFRDRIVHHLLYNFCADWWDRHFITDSYSCRIGKGTLFGQKRLAHHLRCATKNYRVPAFAVKLDIQGYFMSLDHSQLFARTLWGLNRQFQYTRSSQPRIPLDQPEFFAKNSIFCRPQDRYELYQTLKFLWQRIIFDHPMDNIEIHGSRRDWQQLPPTKSLFNQPAHRGIVIGNLTSQLLSNIYLDQLDRFVTFDLGYAHYGRYVDDFYIIVPDHQREQLLRDLVIIENYLADELKLTLHPHKRYKQPAVRGIPFIGAVIYPHCIIPGRRTRHNSYRAAYRLAALGEGSAEGFMTRLGSNKHINSYQFFKKLFDSFGWEFE